MPKKGKTAYVWGILLFILICTLYLISRAFPAPRFFKDISAHTDASVSPRSPYIIVQYDNRPLSKEHAAFAKNNRDYAKKHGYDYVLVTKGYDDIPPYWAKVKCVIDFLPKYKGALWIDSDAYILNTDLSLDDAFSSEKDFTYSPDCILFIMPAKMNAGVWFVRNTQMGREIMTKWYGCYRPEDWTRGPNGKWTSKGAWAGNTYEQGAFVEYIIPGYTQYLEIKPWIFLQGFYISDESFILHFAGPVLKLLESPLGPSDTSAAHATGNRAARRSETAAA